MSGGIMDLLLHPDAFFARVVQEKVNLVPPLLIVGTGVAVNILMVFLVVSGFSRSGYSVDFLRIGGLQRDVLAVYLIKALLVPFGQWGFAAIAAYGISRVFSGRGSFPATVQNVGYGMLPWTLSMGIPVILFIYSFFINTLYGPFSGLWLTDPYTCTIISFVVMIWSGCLWIFAIRHTHGFSLRKAAGISILSVAFSSGALMALSYLSGDIKIGFITVF